MTDRATERPLESTEEVVSGISDRARLLLEKSMLDGTPIDELITGEEEERQRLMLVVQEVARAAGLSVIFQQTDGEVAVGVQQPGESQELSPEQSSILSILKGRYERNEHNIACHNEVEWARVEAKLRANPAKLTALHKMESTGGEPDVYKVEGDDFIFGDLSLSVNAKRNNVTYFEARDRAKGMGAGTELMSPDDYRYMKNTLKIYYLDSGLEWVWLNTEDRQSTLDAGLAFSGRERGATTRVYPIFASNGDSYGAFRCSLRV